MGYHIEIFAPRWHDRKVLIAKYKVQYGSNNIEFTKARNLKGRVFTMAGAEIAKYPLSTNGTIPCYEVPLEVVLEGDNAV